MPKRLDSMTMLLAFSLTSCTAPSGGSLADVQLFIEDEVILAPASARLSAQNVVRGPDGAIWLNTGEPEPGLFRSTDQGRTWETLPVKLSNVPPGQHLGGFHAARDGSLWLVHQAAPYRIVDGKSIKSTDRRGFFPSRRTAAGTGRRRSLTRPVLLPTPRRTPIRPSISPGATPISWNGPTGAPSSPSACATTIGRTTPRRIRRAPVSVT